VPFFFLNRQISLLEDQVKWGFGGREIGVVCGIFLGVNFGFLDAIYWSVFLAFEKSSTISC
jgi:hypothetical protein